MIYYGPELTHPLHMPRRGSLIRRFFVRKMFLAALLIAAFMVLISTTAALAQGQLPSSLLELFELARRRGGTVNFLRNGAICMVEIPGGELLFTTREFAVMPGLYGVTVTINPNGTVLIPVPEEFCRRNPPTPRPPLQPQPAPAWQPVEQPEMAWLWATVIIAVVLVLGGAAAKSLGFA